MGAYSPAPVMTPAVEERVMAEIVRPTLAAMAARGAPFRGILFAGLMITAERPKLIEYNTRFGDPECEVLMPRLASDLVALMLAAVDGRLGQVEVRWHDLAALTVVMCGQGYPGEPKKGGLIEGIDDAEALEGVVVFQAGTAERDGVLVGNGGRVLNLVGLGATWSRRGIGLMPPSTAYVGRTAFAVATSVGGRWGDCDASGSVVYT